jgi:hypothetical protein
VIIVKVMVMVMVMVMMMMMVVGVLLAVAKGETVEETPLTKDDTDRRRYDDCEGDDNDNDHDDGSGGVIGICERGNCRGDASYKR